MQAYIDHFSLPYTTYKELHAFSLQPKFWDTLFSFFPIVYEGELSPQIHGTTWYPNIKLSYAENLLQHREGTAIDYLHESGTSRSLSYPEITSLVGGLQQHLSLAPGDVAAGYTPNTPEALIAMLASNASGATYASVSCDFGVAATLDRLSQVQPKVLFAAKSYTYKGKFIDLVPRVEEIVSKVPSIKQLIWLDEIKDKAPPTFTRLPFDATSFILFSSGTTGKPKALLHRNGGVLLQHIKELGLHYDLKASDSMLFFTTTGWMMWNWLASALFFGSRIGLFEGCPTAVPFFQLMDEHKFTHVGVSPKLLASLEPHPLPHVKKLLSTGAPLPEEQFHWCWENLNPKMQICSMSGGTDILGCFALGHPTLPNPAGELQCIGLGMDVAAFDDNGNPVVDSPGELVCRNVTPSMPKGILGDHDASRFKAAYYERFPNVWHHGDFIQISSAGSVRIDGRSDATLNPAGVRIGTAEIYRQLEQLDWIEDSICVQKEDQIILFVQLKPGHKLDNAQICSHLKEQCTPRHVPSQIHPVKGIPYTQNGKKLEVLISRLVNGRKLENLSSVSNPEILQDYHI